VPATFAAPSGQRLPRLLCAVVLLVILLAVLYAGWVGLTNFSRIRV
jgi:hypothetical protein